MAKKLQMKAIYCNIIYFAIKHKQNCKKRKFTNAQEQIL